MDCTELGSLKFPHGFELDWLNKMPATCSLDVAAEGAHILDDVARLLNVTRERVRQEEEDALAKLRDYCVEHGIEPGFIFTQTDYVTSPAEEALGALGLKEQTPWLTKLWQKLLTNADLRSPI